MAATKKKPKRSVKVKAATPKRTKATPKGKAPKRTATAKRVTAPPKRAKAAAKRARATPKPSPVAAKTKPSLSVFITLNEPVQPIDRGDRYEDPVFAALERIGLGGSGDGGGTLSNPDGEIEEADFDATITAPAGIAVITRLLEEAGAAKGSKLEYERDGKTVVVPFGITEGVAIYLDGVTQPAEVYKTTSLDELLDKMGAVLGEDLDFRGSWQGPRETALYLYGLDAEHLFAQIEPVLRAYPLSRNARVVIGHKSDARREVHLAATKATA